MILEHMEGKYAPFHMFIMILNITSTRCKVYKIEESTMHGIY